MSATFYECLGSDLVERQIEVVGSLDLLWRLGSHGSHVYTDSLASSLDAFPFNKYPTQLLEVSAIQRTIGYALRTKLIPSRILDDAHPHRRSYLVVHSRWVQKPNQRKSACCLPLLRGYYYGLMRASHIQYTQLGLMERSSLTLTG